MNDRLLSAPLTRKVSLIAFLPPDLATFASIWSRRTTLRNLHKIGGSAQRQKACRRSEHAARSPRTRGWAHSRKLRVAYTTYVVETLVISDGEQSPRTKQNIQMTRSVVIPLKAKAEKKEAEAISKMDSVPPAHGKLERLRHRRKYDHEQTRCTSRQSLLYWFHECQKYGHVEY